MMEREVAGHRGRGTKAARKAAGGKRSLTVPRFFTTPGSGPGRRDGVGAAARPDHRRGRQGGLRAEGRRGPEELVACWPPTWSPPSTSAARSARPSASARCASSSRRVVRHHHRAGAREGGYFATEDGRRHLPRRADPPALPAEDGLQLARSGSTSASRSTRSARPASSTRSTTRWTRSSSWPRPRACSSSTARAPAPTSPASAPRRELLAGGGTASGPVSFMRGFDAFAGVIKSAARPAARPRW